MYASNFLKIFKSLQHKEREILNQKHSNAKQIFLRNEKQTKTW